MTTNTDHHHLTRHERTHLDHQLTTLIDWLADELDDTITRQTSPTPGPRINNPTTTPALTYNDRASTAGRHLHQLLNHWIATTCTQRHYPHPGTTTRTIDTTPVPYAPNPRTYTERRPLTIKAAATWLHHPRHLIAFSLTDNANQGADHIVAAIKTVRHVIDKPPTPTYLGACATTTCPGELWALPEDTHITCPTCGTIEPRDTITARVDKELRSRLFTARELVTIVADRLGQTIKPKTIYTLTYRRGNPITARGTNRHGDTLYLCGDVLDALTRRPRKRTRTSTNKRHTDRSHLTNRTPEK